MKSNLHAIGYLMMLVLICVAGCRTEHDENIITPSSPDESLQISLRWSKAYTDEDHAKVETGLHWALSFLGAEWPQSSYVHAVSWTDQTHLSVNLNKAGFSENAKKVWAVLLQKFKSSDEYIRTGGIDIGRFIMLTLNAAHHYAALTGTDSIMQDFISRYNFDTTKAAIIESAIAKHHRLIEVPANEDAKRIAFLASEGNGSLINGTFVPAEFEAFDIMPNGQLRFMLFDAQGDAKTTADTALTAAGKPAKCLWCHEMSLTPPFFAQTSVPGYFSPTAFRSIIEKHMRTLDQWRLTLKSDLDFGRKQDHTIMELLYISFMEPSAERLAIEWSMTIEAVKEKLAGQPTHVHQEFPTLGDLYDRKDIEPFAPYAGIRVPDSAREYSAYEPDLLH